MQRLKDSGHLTFDDGAWWLSSTAYGDDKDRVVIKSDGDPAYIAGDLAYFLDKRARGFDLCIYMLGADHHGYIARLKAAAAALGDDPDVVEVLIGQMVNLVRDGVPLRMSKRAGTVITLDDLIDALGVDAARYALIRYSVDTTLDLDLDLWTRQTSDNPVFYVQYAHARLASLARNAADLGIDLGRRLRPGAAGHPAGVGADRPARRLPGRAGHRRRTARTAPGRPVPGGSGVRLPQVLRLGPGAADGRRSRQPTPPSPGCGCAPPPGRCWPTAWPCSASTPRSGCEGASGRTPVRRAAHRPARAGRARRPEPARPGGLAARRVPQRGRRAEPGRRRRPRPAPSSYGTPLMVIDEADFRSRCQDFADAFGGAERRALRRQGVPVQRDRALAARRGAGAGRLHGRRAAAGAAGRIPGRPDRAARLQQVRRPS